MAYAYELILFDLDGTLTDSAPGILESVTYAYQSLGLPVPGEAELATFVGPPLHVSAPKHGVPPELIKPFLMAYREKFVAGAMFNNSVYAGIRELLDALDATGIPMGIATSKPEVFARQILEHYELAHHFTFIAGATLDGVRSAKADVITHALASLTQELGELPKTQNIIMVGDREHDVLGAAAHSIATIGVRWGYAPEGELQDAGAAYIADTTEELLALLTQPKN